MQNCATHTQTTAQYHLVKKLKEAGKHPLGSGIAREFQTEAGRYFHKTQF
jgi:hypothetical protein